MNRRLHTENSPHLAMVLKATPGNRRDLDMRPRYREDKTTQAVAMLIELSGGSINYYVVLKLLYLADREALIEWGQPITFDSYVSMDHGPVLSTTYDLLKGTSGVGHGQYWNEHISKPNPYEYEVTVTAPTGTEKLSDAEIDLLRQMHAQYGHMQWGKLRDLIHSMRLPEWQDPHGSSRSIEYDDILRAALKDETEVEAIIAELDLVACLDERLPREAV